MNQNTLGQYYPSGSVIHRLDPRVKLFGVIVFIVALFLCSKWQFVFVTALCLAAVICASKVPLKHILKQLRFVIVLLLISSVFNLFLTSGTTAVRLGPLEITYEGIWRTIYIALRLIMLVMGTSLLTFTSTATELTSGLETALSILSRAGLPIHELAMMMSIALRFIPILMEETDKIMKAQMARGADFESGNIIQKAKSLIPILVPLFVSAFRRANDLAMAMEARGYHGGEGRTRLKPLEYKRADYIAYTVLALFVILMFLASRIRFPGL